MVFTRKIFLFFRLLLGLQCAFRGILKEQPKGGQHMKKFWSRTGILLLCVWLVSISVSAANMLIPVGQVVGLELGDNSVTVTAFDENLGAAAQKAGLKVGDRIMKVNSKDIHTTEDVRYALDHSDGTVELTVLRNKKTDTIRFSPAITQDGPKLGVYLKQGVTGIGTVTWYDPESQSFAALGHGVNTPNGQLLTLTQGNTYEARILSVKKGKAGAPGQLMGALTSNVPMGSLQKNTPQGVFGTSQTIYNGAALPVAAASEVEAGPAKILSNISGQSVQEYSVEILKIYASNSTSDRNMLIRVTDPQLLSATGGIVQGMSGSPIIQDGKLVGAVTHVLVNDPTTGYGIFIENMLDAAA